MLKVSDCSKLTMKTLEQHQCCRSGIFIVNCEHISHIVLVVDFELANICWVYIEKTNTLRSSSQEMFCEKGVLRNFTKSTGKHLCQSLFFNNVSGLKVNNKDTRTTPGTLAQVFSCEFCEISKNTLSYRTPLVAASALLKTRSCISCVLM